MAAGGRGSQALDRSLSGMVLASVVIERGSLTRTWTLVAVCLTTFMLLLDITVVVVALPNIQQRFDASLTGLAGLPGQ